MGVVLCVDALAWAAAARQEPARALTLLGAADAAWAAIPAAPTAPLRQHHDEALAAAREAVPDGEYRAAFAAGAVMSQADVIALALGESARPAARPRGIRTGAGPGPGPGPLTRREREVAALVAQGLSNGQVAAALVISARTVESHVQHIMDKLGFRTRAQIAAWSAGQADAGEPPAGG